MKIIKKNRIFPRRYLCAALAAALCLALVFPALAAGGSRYIVSGDSADLLAYPSETAGKLGFIPGGTILTPSSYSGDWAQVSYQGSSGYVSLGQLTLLASGADDGITGIRVTRTPDKVRYIHGDDAFIDAAGLKITADKKDGGSEDVTGFVVSAPALDSPGKKTVEVTWSRPGYAAVHRTSFEITLDPLPLASLEIDTMPKTQYIEGQFLDVDSLRLKATFTDGRESEVFSAAEKAGSLVFSLEPGAEVTPAGTKTVEVYYMYPDFSASFELEIKEKRLIELKILAPPDKTEYYEGDRFDPAGMAVGAVYDNGRTYEVDDYTLSPEILAVDTKNVNVAFGHLAVNTPVNVSPLKLMRLDLKLPTQTRIRPGEKPDLSDMVVYAVYNSGKKTAVGDYDLSDIDASTVGRKTVTVSYEGLTAEFRFIVSEDYLPGDTDRDGEVTAADARLTLRSAIELEKLTAQQELIADHDGDEEITVADARLILRLAIGLD